MKLYLDTSSLFKLYHDESGTQELDNFFSANNIVDIFLSEITKVEYVSAVYKRARMKDLSGSDAEIIIKLFESDLQKYSIIPVNSITLEKAKILIGKYGQDGLRTLDSMQLASAIEVKNIVNKYFTSDQLLHTLFLKENLPV